jgi:hypothetical protein
MMLCQSHQSTGKFASLVPFVFCSNSNATLKIHSEFNFSKGNIFFLKQASNATSQHVLSKLATHIENAELLYAFCDNNAKQFVIESRNDDC